jgi:hypothetical protein
MAEALWKWKIMVILLSVFSLFSFTFYSRTILHFEIILMTMVIVVLLVFISIAENFPGVSIILTNFQLKLGILNMRKNKLCSP